MLSFTKNFYKKNQSLLTFVFLFSASFFVRLLPFLIYGPNPLGYDTGFYRRYLIQPFTSFPNTVVPGLGSDALVPRIILDLLRLAHLPVNYALYGSYIVFASIIPCLIYYILSKKCNRNVGLFGAALFILSPIQYAGFWFMLWKNIFALNLLLIAFIFIDKEKSKKNFIAIIGLDILIGLSHTTTSIIYIGTLLFFILLNRKNYKETIFHILITSLILLSAHPKLYTTHQISQTVGVFIEWKEFFILSIPFILLSIFTLKNTLNHLKKSIILAFGLLTTFFVVFRLPFYERIFLFTDISLIFTASIGGYYMIRTIFKDRENGYVTNKKKYIYGIILIVATGYLLGNTAKQIKTLVPLMKESNIESIKLLSSKVGSSATIITSTDEAPWYEGFTTAHIVAPGMLNDIYNFDDWNNRWNSTSTSDQIKFLEKFPQPLYISTFGKVDEIIGTPAPCIGKETDHLWKVNCFGK